MHFRSATHSLLEKELTNPLIVAAMVAAFTYNERNFTKHRGNVFLTWEFVESQLQLRGGTRHDVHVRFARPSLAGTSPRPLIGRWGGGRGSRPRRHVRTRRGLGIARRAPFLAGRWPRLRNCATESLFIDWGRDKQLMDSGIGLFREFCSVVEFF